MKRKEKKKGRNNNVFSFKTYPCIYHWGENPSRSEDKH